MVGNLAETQLGFRGELIKDLIANGCKVLLFSSDYTDKTRTQAKAIGAEPIDYPMCRKGLNPLRDIHSTWVLYRLFKKYKVTISFCSFAKPVIWGTIAAWMAGVPKRIAKIEGLGRNFVEPPGGIKLKQRLIRGAMLWLFALSLPKAHKVYVLNKDDKHDLLKTYKLKIPNIEVIGGIGVCLAQYPYVPPKTDKLRFIFVGRLLDQKGIRYYLQAAETIKNAHKDVEFIVLGQPDGRGGGVTRQELMRYVQTGVITYPGQVDNVVEWLNHCNVFVLPSYYREGVPRSTQEALAVGRAVITTDMPGCRETVNDSINGYLVPPHDQKALERAMKAFVTSPELAQSMGLESFKMAREKFDVRKINRRILRDLL